LNKISISKGTGYMLIAGIAFAGMNVSVKFLNHIPLFEIILVRVLITLILSYRTLKIRKINPWGNNKKFLILRGFFGGCGLICYFYTLQNMEIANAIVIHYLSPIFTTVIAIFVFSERVKFIQWISFGISFLGVIAVKGFAKVETMDFIVGILGALFTGLAYNAIKNMKNKEESDVIIFYHPLVTLPLTIVYFLMFPQPLVMPNLFELLLLVATGICTQIGQYFITRAYQIEDAAKISSVTYVGIIWGVLIGKFMFNDHYSASVLLGMFLVIGGVLLNLNYQKVLNFFKNS